jgi:guanylate kinase
MKHPQKYKRIILVGKAASGKDYARVELQERGFTYCKSHTTRPRRHDEINGEDYHFISLDAAIHHYIMKDLFYEYVIFNGWVYGTSLEEFDKSNLFIMTPSGISKMKEEDRNESFIVYFNIDWEVRKNRLLLRNDVDGVTRRLDADELDFKDFDDYDYMVTDAMYDPTWLFHEIKNYLIEKHYVN